MEEKLQAIADLLTTVSSQLAMMTKNDDVNNITDISTLIPYQELTYTIAAGARQDIFAVFNYFRVVSQSGGALSTRFGQNGLETPFTGQGIGVNFRATFPRLTLINTGGTSMTITVALAIGTINDDRLNVSGTVSVQGTVSTNDNPGTTVAYNQVSVTSTATLISAQSTAKRHVIIKNHTTSAQTLFIGDSAVTTGTGIELAIGESITIDTEAAIYGRTASGTATVGYFEMRD